MANPYQEINASQMLAADCENQIRSGRFNVKARFPEFDFFSQYFEAEDKINVYMYSLLVRYSFILGSQNVVFLAVWEEITN
jgi:hypothetical protein